MQSPDFFSFYRELVFCTIKNLDCVKVVWVNINHLQYIDDIVLIASPEDNLQVLLDKVKESRALMALSVNGTKNKW